MHHAYGHLAADDKQPLCYENTPSATVVFAHYVLACVLTGESDPGQRRSSAVCPIATATY